MWTELNRFNAGSNSGLFEFNGPSGLRKDSEILGKLND